MQEKPQRIRAYLVRKLKRELDPPKSWKAIAAECGFSLGRLKKWLAGASARLDNIAVLAKSLKTTADKIIRPDGEEEPFMTEGFHDIERPEDVTALFQEIQKRTGSKYRLFLKYDGTNSIRIGIKIHIGLTFSSDSLKSSLQNNPKELLNIIKTHLTKDEAMLSYHMWMDGLRLDQVAERFGKPEDQIFLSWQSIMH